MATPLNLKHPLNSESELSPHEVQVSYSYSASYVIVTMSHNSSSLKQLLLFLQNFTWREYQAASTTGVFCFVLIFKQVYGRSGLWLINAIYFSFPWYRRRHLNEIIRESSSICLYISGKSIHKYGRLGLWFSDVFQTSALKLFNKILQEASTYKCITSLNQLVFPGIWNSLTTTWLPMYLIDLLVFNLSATAARTLTKC